jgi:hypothetical protein
MYSLTWCPSIRTYVSMHCLFTIVHILNRIIGHESHLFSLAFSHVHYCSHSWSVYRSQISFVFCCIFACWTTYSNRQQLIWTTYDLRWEHVCFSQQTICYLFIFHTHDNHRYHFLLAIFCMVTCYFLIGARWIAHSVSSIRKRYFLYNKHHDHTLCIHLSI